MKLARSQKGMSMLGWLVVLALVAFFASTAFKMFPHYMDFWALEKAITSLETDRASEVSTVRDFYSHVEKSMQVNGIRDIKLDDVLEVQLDGNEFLVHLQYEKREPLIENLDLVANFDKEFRIRAQ
jgi:type II secretory pathway pseudopilin PulG